jgi:diguanylate cyclase (GGDEF)-like protein
MLIQEEFASMPQITDEKLTQKEQPTQARAEAATPPAEPPSPERRGLARAAHRSYYRLLRLSRLAYVAFFTMAALLLLWMAPWVPSGLDAEDYTPQLTFTLYLLLAVVFSALVVIALRELTRRRRESLLVWAAVFDEATGLHNRTYLYDRLSLECERAERIGGVFSILVLQIRFGKSPSERPPSLSDAAWQKMAELINRNTHPTDMVALLSGGELAVLAMRVDRESRKALLERLRTALAVELPALLPKAPFASVVGGVATYGVEGTDAGALVQAARAAAALALPSRGQAA